MKCILLLLTIVSAQVCFAQHADDEAFFESRVRPLLAQRCFDCHRRKSEGGLRLDSLASMLKGGTSGPALIAGDPAMSLIWQVVAGKHPVLSMPPEKPLSDGEVEIIKQWIEKNAPWPNDPSKTRDHGITDKERSFWALRADFL